MGLRVKRGGSRDADFDKIGGMAYSNAAIIGFKQNGQDGLFLDQLGQDVAADLG